MKSIVLTGGGTGGHVIPNIALIPSLQKEGYKITYIGSKTGIEKQLITSLNIEYHEISSGKLRRYLDIKNVTDMFRVCRGISDAFLVLKKIKPNLVFSKGGFVSVPVVIAAKLLKIPVIIHESDITPGLANRIALPYASTVCVSFPECYKSISNKYKNVVLTGTPIREELYKGSKEKGLKFCGFNEGLPVLLVMGGSLGSVKINNTIREILPSLTSEYQIIHICGKDNVDNGYLNQKNYKQFEYISEELPDIFQAADYIISRAGANAIFEFLALKKPNLLIPLSRQASRGDQILNANSFKNQGFSLVLEEEEVSKETLMNRLKELRDSAKFKEKMEKSEFADGVKQIMAQIRKFSTNK